MNQPDPTDAILVLRCQLGDHSAWDALVRRWHPRLWSFISRMLTDRQIAEDTLQIVWLKVVRSLVRLKDPARLDAWMFRIARMSVADQLRRRYRMTVVEPLESDQVEEDEALGALESQELIQQGLRNLVPIDREAIVLHYIEQFSIADVAAICGVAEGTIKSRLHRARRTLRDALSPHESPND
ncbi:MAG: RNA polymerase sigma factor [Planctomycetota bacterium]